MRKCVACGKHKSEFELIKVVNNNEQILIDPGVDLPGRGTYICPSQECLEIAREEKSIEKALKTQEPGDIYKKLMEEISNE
ncbi:MAG: YlxR family protein [Halanaerobiales bacterium]|nr:YlxR family protein [Halanaerobiales bacterium]